MKSYAVSRPSGRSRASPRERRRYWQAAGFPYAGTQSRSQHYRFKVNGRAGIENLYGTESIDRADAGAGTEYRMSFHKESGTVDIFLNLFGS